MEKKIYGIFVAGGSGSRMGSSLPKQFLELDGRPILQVTIEKFVDAVPQMKVVTVLPRQYFDKWKKLCCKHSMNIPQILVEGGITRFHSVKNALAGIPDDAIVFIHDGVRPLLSSGMIMRILKEMETQRAVVPVIPVTDTLKSSDRTAPDPDRSSVVAAQTPQVFLSEDIRAAYGSAYDISFTDDASVAKRAGIPVTFIEGEKYNIKITTPEDLRIAELLVRNRLNP